MPVRGKHSRPVSKGDSHSIDSDSHESEQSLGELKRIEYTSRTPVELLYPIYA